MSKTILMIADIEIEKKNYRYKVTVFLRDADIEILRFVSNKICFGE